MTRPTATRLLTRHFLRRFLDNDLISPHVDLHENTTLVCAAIVSTSLFFSVALAAKFLVGMLMPGPTAILAVADHFFFIGASMIVMALVAAVQWDALSLDARDTSNLGPLPIATRAMVRAKITALVIFATGFALALNLVPSTVYQTLLLTKIPVGLAGLVRLIAAHAVTAILASAFGFLAVIALKEVLRAMLGAALFARVSTIVQALLVLVLISALLLLPGGPKQGMAAAGFPGRYFLPPLWFVGLEEVLGGGTIANVVGVRVPPRMVSDNERWLAVYRANEPVFRELAELALLALAVVTVVAVAAYAWNARQLPQPVASSPRKGRVLALAGAAFAARDAVARAGFTFAIQALLRSTSHRLAMAVAGALAIALSFILLGRIDLSRPFDAVPAPHSLLSLQTVMLIMLLGGFRHAVRVPAELKANWMLQMAWRGGERRFLRGVKRAAVVSIAAPILVLLLPLHLWFLPERTVAAHLAIGAFFSIAAVEALFAGFRNVPFAASYVPAGNVKALGPIGFVAFVLFVSGFARLERAAMATDEGIAILIAGLISTAIVLRLLDIWLRRGRLSMAFEDAPEPATQWLGLSG